MDLDSLSAPVGRQVKGFRYRLYPTAEQRDLLERTFGCCRYVYNRALAEAKDEYQAWLVLREAGPLTSLKKPDVSGYGFVKRLPQYKADPESSWLTEVSSIALQQSMLHLGAAFQRFFKEKKGYPQFKKKQNRQSFTLTANNSFSLRDGVFIMAKHIADAAWASFAGKLAHKVAESQHATLVQMDPFYPSSHLCSVTGQRLDRKLSLAERDWHCPHCGQVHDRDVNAACNILNKSLETLAKYDTATVAGKVVLAKR